MKAFLCNETACVLRAKNVAFVDVSLEFLASIEAVELHLKGWFSLINATIIAPLISVDAGGSVSIDGLSALNASSLGQRPQPPPSGTSMVQCPGATYGGVGGYRGAGGISPSLPSDRVLSPHLPGVGGDCCACSASVSGNFGRGGGRIFLSSAKDVVLEGILGAEGGSALVSAVPSRVIGGGSGGTIVISASSMACHGNPHVSATGGRGQSGELTFTGSCISTFCAADFALKVVWFVFSRILYNHEHSAGLTNHAGAGGGGRVAIPAATNVSCFQYIDGVLLKLSKITM